MADKPITDPDVIQQILNALPTVTGSVKGLMPSNGFIDRGVINTHDFDTLINNGIYLLSNSTGNNAPTTYGVMFVVGGANMILQIVANAVYPFDLKVRIKGFGEPNWKNWKSIG